MKIHELLTDESKWTRHTWARDKDGVACDPLAEEAVKWSLAGASFKCYGEDLRVVHDINRRLENAVRCQNHEYWQDSPGRTFAEVRELIVKLNV